MISIDLGTIIVEIDDAALDIELPEQQPSVTLQPLTGTFSLSEAAAQNAVAGTLSGQTAGSTLSIIANAGNRVAISGANIVRGTVALDYETATSHSFTVRETLAGATNSPRDTVLTLAVTNALDAPSLSALSLSATSFTTGTPSSGTIIGATAGSTIVASNLPAGLTVNGAARTFAWSGTGSVSTPSITLTETLGDSPNSPRSTNIGLTITAVAPPAPANRAVFTILSDSLGPGRSNQDSARVLADDPYPTNARAYVNHSSQPNYQQLSDSAAPLWFPDGTPDARISPMERLLIRYNEVAGEKVGIIPCGVGGSSLINTWLAPNGSHLVNAKNAHNAAIALYRAEDSGAYVAGIELALSSNNLGSDQAAVRAAWIDLIDYVRANFDHVTDDTTIVISGPCTGGTVGGVRRLDAEWAAAQRINCFVQHPPYPTTASDNLHPTLAENRIWGASLADQFYLGNEGTQELLTISTSATQGLVAGTPLALNIVHSGLSKVARFGKVEITSGADAALFTVGGTFDAPQIVEKSPSTLTPRAYTFDVQVRNSQWELGPKLTVNLTVAAAQAQTSDVGFEYVGGQMDVASTYGAASFSNIPVAEGRNLLILYLDNGSNRDAGFTLKVDGNTATKVAALTTGDTIEVWEYTSAIATTVNLAATWNVGTTNISVAVVKAKGLASTLSGPKVELARNIGKRPFKIGDMSPPTYGRSLVIAIGNNIDMQDYKQFVPMDLFARLKGANRSFNLSEAKTPSKAILTWNEAANISLYTSGLIISFDRKTPPTTGELTPIAEEAVANAEKYQTVGTVARANTVIADASAAGINVAAWQARMAVLKAYIREAFVAHAVNRTSDWSNYSTDGPGPAGTAISAIKTARAEITAWSLYADQFSGGGPVPTQSPAVTVEWAAPLDFTKALQFNGTQSFRFDGLDNAKTYDFEIFASRFYADTVERNQFFTASGTASVDSNTTNLTNNTDKIMKVAGLRPVNGSITITPKLAAGNPNGTGYLNISRIRER